MSENGYVTPEQLFKPLNRKYHDVEVGLGKFRIRSLNAAEYGEFEAEKISPMGKLSRNALITNAARLIVLCCVNEQNEPIFSRSDVSRIQELDASGVLELSAECEKHSGIQDTSEKN